MAQSTRSNGPAERTPESHTEGEFLELGLLLSAAVLEPLCISSRMINVTMPMGWPRSCELHQLQSFAMQLAPHAPALRLLLEALL
jgi:hypothetical protein